MNTPGLREPDTARDAAPAVEVLIATYNGERFLREQIDSVLSQTYSPLRVLARDDGSTDGTRGILEEFASRFEGRFRVLDDRAAATGLDASGDTANGAKGNFMRLLAASEAGYIAFCDQDDVWLPEKIADEMAAMRRLEAVHGDQTPLLVFTDLRVVDSVLQELSPSFWQQQNVRPQYIRRLPRLLTGNVVTGCTALINAALRERALPMPRNAFMHDWWLALVASIFGKAEYLPTPSVLYRQHGGNVLGASQGTRPTGVPRWRYHDQRRKRWEEGATQAAALLAALGPSMPARARRVVAEYLRCETSPSRLERVFRFVRRGHFATDGVRSNAALLWYLWDMNWAKRQGEGL